MGKKEDEAAKKLAADKLAADEAAAALAASEKAAADKLAADEAAAALAASETVTEEIVEVDKTRSLAIIAKHGTPQMNENHLPGHIARNLASLIPAEEKENFTAEEIKIKTDALAGAIKDMLYGEAPENDDLLKAIEEMPVGGYGY